MRCQMAHHIHAVMQDAKNVDDVLTFGFTDPKHHKMPPGTALPGHMQHQDAGREITCWLATQDLWAASQLL